MRPLILCLALAGCGLRAEGPPHDPNPIIDAVEICDEGRVYWVFVRSDGQQEPPSATGRTCAATAPRSADCRGGECLPSAPRAARP